MILLRRAGFGGPVSAEQLDLLEERTDRILSAGDCLAVRNLALSGSDLIRMGIRPGPGLGSILGTMLDRVLRDPGLNTRECLERIAEEAAEGRGNVPGRKSGNDDASE